MTFLIKVLDPNLTGLLLTSEIYGPNHDGTPYRMRHLGFVDFPLRQRRKQDRQPSDMSLERVARFAVACRTQVRRFGDFGLLMEVVAGLAPYVRWQRSNDEAQKSFLSGNNPQNGTVTQASLH